MNYLPRLLVSHRRDGRRQDGRGHRAGPAARRRDHLARLDGHLSRHGHRHREAIAAERGGRAAPSDRYRRSGATSTASPSMSMRPRVDGRRHSRPRQGAAVRGRHAAVSQKPAARPVRRAAGRLAAAARDRSRNWQHVGQQALYDRLAQIDPVAASHIHPHDTRRLIRALEVYRATGEPISHQQIAVRRRPAGGRVPRVRAAAQPRGTASRGSKSAWRRWSTPGWWTKFAAAHWRTAGELGRTARQAVGYREALAYLAGEYDHDEMIARIKARTRRFAKRQGTWFRSLSECRFVDIEGEVDADAIAEQRLSRSVIDGNSNQTGESRAAGSGGVALRLLRCVAANVAAASAGFFFELNRPDRHAAVDALAHVVDGERRDSKRPSGLPSRRPFWPRLAPSLRCASVRSSAK